MCTRSTILSRHLVSSLRNIRCGSNLGRSGPCSTWVSSGEPLKTFYSRDLLITPTAQSELREKPKNADNLGFGVSFSDHMAEIDWDSTNGWHRPLIRRMEPFAVHPASKALHYAAQLFEGMKAYRGVDGKIRLFRPEMNMDRMRRTSARCALPDFDGEQLIDIITQLVRLDSAWIPFSDVASLYIRPTLIGTDPTLGVSTSNQAKLFVLTCPVGGYFGNNKAVTLLADPRATRACLGGVGAFKMGSNYAPTVHVGKEAEKKGCQQVLWLGGKEQWVTEAGTMNLFVFWKNEQGEEELITPSLASGTILPGVTRQSLLDLSRQWGQFKVSERDFTMSQLRKAIKEKRVYEMFGAGTAAVVAPVEGILYLKKDGSEERLSVPTLISSSGVMKKLYNAMVDIQYGRTEQPGWTREID